MLNSQIKQLLTFANLQMAAEAFWLGEGSISDSEQIQSVLERGNTHASRFMPVQAAQFADEYEILAHRNNEPRVAGGTGFSGTLFRNRATGELTLSFRSSEFIDDAVRDSKSTNELEIKQLGWAFGQIAEMEDWFASLRQSGVLNDASGQIRPFNVTGYSLGGHLATAFNILRREAGESNLILGTYTFNGAGTGGLLNGRRLTDVIADFKQYRDDPNITTSGAWAALPLETRNQIYDAAVGRSSAIEAERQRLQTLQAEFAFDTRPPAGIQASLPYQIAVLLAARDTVGASNFPLPGGVNWIPSSPVFAAPDQRFANMIEIVGSEGGNLGPSFISNSGIHYGTRQEIYIEDQPLVRGSFPLLDILQRNLLVDNPSVNDFGDTHSLVLLVDSLSLMSALEAIDPNLTPETAREIYAAMSNAKADSAIGTQGSAEGDSLERMLDAARKIVLGPSAEPTLENYEDTLVGNTWHSAALREPFHARLQELTGAIASVPGPLTLSSLANMSAAEMTTRAQAAGGLAYRYALGSLNPFAILGPDAVYALHNATGEFDIYSPAASTRSGMTREYVADRADFLAWKNIANTTNVGRLPGAPGPDNWRFIDQTQKYKLTVVGQVLGSDSTAPSHLANFGTERADAIMGGTETDRLYGSAGTDLMRGGAAGDYLEGGNGTDIYEYAASTTLGLIDRNDGNDTIRDVDGKGVLRYTYTPSLGSARSTIITDASVKVNDTTWQSSDGKITYTKAPNAEGATDLVVTFNGDAGGSMTLKDFRDGDFGIRLHAPQTREYAGASGTISGTDLNDSLSGTPIAEILLALAGADIVRAGAGDDSVLGGDGDDALYGDADHDRLYGDAGRDSLYGGSGNDELYGGANADILEGEDGADLLAGGSSGDVVVGGAGADEVHAEDVVPLATALALGETEAPTGLRGEWVDGGEGEDTVVGGAGNDQVMGGGGADVLVGGAGDDNLVGDMERTLVHVDNWMVTRQVVVSGNSTNYQLVYNADAQAAESAYGADDVIYGGAGSDWIFAGTGDDFTDGGTGDDVVFGEAGADVLIGGAGNDVLIGDNPGVVDTADEGGDVLDGGAGDDQLHGNGGDDILFGGPGNDTLVGGAGRDLYVFNKGDGTDTIVDTPAGADDPGASVLVLGEGVSRDSIKFRTGSLHVDLGDGDGVHVEGFDWFDPASTPVLGSIQFADGSSMSYAEILEQGFDIDGTEEDDDAHDAVHPQLLGTAVSDRIRGLGGNDQLFGFAGDDVLSGGAGDDALIGDEGDDVLDGDAGADTLWGGPGNDTLAGSPGDDVLLGESGNDVYRFESGDGRDLIFEQDATAGNLDRVEFGSGISPDDIDATRGPLYPGDLVLSIHGGSDALTIANQFVEAQYQVEEIRFADGTAWTPAMTPMLIRGTTAGEILFGTAGPDVFEGLAGNDTLAGGAGNDTYRFSRGHGQDTITDSDASAGNVDRVLFAADIVPSQVQASRSGNNLVLAIAGTADRITVTNYFENDGATPYSIEQIGFRANGTVWDVDTVRSSIGGPTEGNDTIIGSGAGDSLYGFGGDDVLRGGGGDDTLVGGSGNDMLYGEGGSDTYQFARGSGQDTIANAEFDGYGTQDVLQFAAGIAPADILLSKSNDDLVLAVAGTSDGVRLQNYFLGDLAVVEQIRFADGSTWTEQSIAGFFPVSGTAGNDLLQGTGLSETISGLAGADTIYGGGGHDTLDGGAGSDRLYGGSGNDLLIAGAGDSKNAAVFNYLYGGSGDDVLVASNKRDYLYGEGGNDIYIGGTNGDWMEDTGGNNLFFGGAGLDSVWLGNQNDIAMGFNSVDGDRDFDGIRGRDVLLLNKTESGGATRLGSGSTVSLGGGVLYKDLSLQAANNLLTLKYGNKTMGFMDWYGDVYSPPNRAVSYLQIVIEGSRDYNPSSSNPMNSQKIQVFDFSGLVAAFDAARAAGQSFNVAGNLARFWLWGSDTEAIGGAVAYQYARSGTLGTLSYDQMRAVTTDPAFAVSAQPIVAAAGAASIATESFSLTDDTSMAQPMAFAVSGETSATAPTATSDVSARSQLADASELRFADLPDEWFAPHTPQESARSIASAWRRVARELPAYLDRSAAWDGLVPSSSGVRVSPADAIGVRVTFDNGVGLSDAAASRLRQFEGLKEGLALLA